MIPFSPAYFLTCSLVGQDNQLYIVAPGAWGQKAIICGCGFQYSRASIVVSCSLGPSTASRTFCVDRSYGS